MQVINNFFIIIYFLRLYIVYLLNPQIIVQGKSCHILFLLLVWLFIKWKPVEFFLGGVKLVCRILLKPSQCWLGFGFGWKWFFTFSRLKETCIFWPQYKRDLHFWPLYLNPQSQLKRSSLTASLCHHHASPWVWLSLGDYLSWFWATHIFENCS